MTKFVFKHIQSATSLASLSYSYNLFHFLQVGQFCASSTFLKPTDSCSDRSSFTINYLIKTCGFTPERALSASKYLKFDVDDKPNSVLTFFKDHGFTQTQISKMVNYHPCFLVSDPRTTLLPKLDFFKSKGISGLDIAVIVSRQPEFLKMSLKNNLIPIFNFFSKFLQSDEKAISVFKRYTCGPMCFFNVKHVELNIEMLKQAGVPIKNISYLVTYQPKLILINQDKLGQAVDEVKKLGFNPSRIQFVLAVHALKSMSKSTWDRKVEVYKKWGWSEGDIVGVFRRRPLCMTLSEEKISLVMEFLVNKMGLSSSFLADRPQILQLSLEKRIVPRCEVYQSLMSKGLVNPGETRLAVMITESENRFLERFIEPHKEADPDIMKLYTHKVGSCKIRSGLED